MLGAAGYTVRRDNSMFKVTIAETRDTGMEESAVIEVKALLLGTTVRSTGRVRLQDLMGVSAMPPASDKLLRRGK